MSKMDALRAMREARYEQSQARAARSTPAPRRASRPTPAPPVPTTGGEPAGADPAAELCGHRSINGRTCTRERGHAAKSHRYA